MRWSIAPHRLVLSATAALIALSLGTGCDLLVYSVPVDREEDGALTFDLGELALDCVDSNPNDAVDYASETIDGASYCRVQASWAGLLFNMAEVRAGVAEELEAAGSPVGVDGVEVKFTDIRVDSVNIGLTKDGATVPFPAIREYSAVGAVDEVSGLIRADWMTEGDTQNNADPTQPDVKFFADADGEGSKQDLLNHLNEAYIAEGQEAGAGDVHGSGSCDILFELSDEALGAANGATLEIDFTLTTSGEGSAGPLSVSSSGGA